jgi:hypothetical protein
MHNDLAAQIQIRSPPKRVPRQGILVSGRLVRGWLVLASSAIWKRDGYHAVQLAGYKGSLPSRMSKSTNGSQQHSNSARMDYNISSNQGATPYNLIGPDDVGDNGDNGDTAIDFIIRYLIELQMDNIADWLHDVDIHDIYDLDRSLSELCSNLDSILEEQICSCDSRMLTMTL